MIDRLIRIDEVRHADGRDATGGRAARVEKTIKAASPAKKTHIAYFSP